MLSRNVVVQTRLTPPRLNQRILRRSRITLRLLESVDYRLTIVHAGAGYGKSTALATLKNTDIILAWYHVSAEDADPIIFFYHLVYACKQFLRQPDTLVTLLESTGSSFTDESWSSLVKSLINQMAFQDDLPAILVLDDFHQVSESPRVSWIVDHLINEAPHNLHFILSTRHPIKLPGMLTLKARGELMLVDQSDLAFTSEEIAALFHDHYSLSLSDAEISALASTTEGWAIGLQLYWHGFKGGLSNPLVKGSQTDHLSADELFAFLAKEVLDRLSPDIQNFLRQTAVLREMNPAICDCLRQTSDSQKYLDYLLENGLFVVQLDQNSVRYHHLFREFILDHLPKEQLLSSHQRAADCYLASSQDEAAIYHLLKANLEQKAAEKLSGIGENLILSGRMETLNTWITSISPDVLADYPLLMVFLGDHARVHSRFGEAMGWYHQAEERSRVLGNINATSQSLYGQAKVYLDTVNPIQAEQVLQSALELVDGREDRESRARLLELLAENKLNSGQLLEAENYRNQARALREIGPEEMELSVRVLLRTGKLDQARKILESMVVAERSEPFPTARAHRETLLLLALILVFQGEWESAYHYAQEGIARGEALRSPFVVAVGKMRLGHAALLKPTRQGYDEAINKFQEAIVIAETLSVPRLKVEALWGLARAYGYAGEITLAEKAAIQGLEQGRSAGDEWISALILASMGASYALAQNYPQAIEWLDRAREKFNKVSDPYGESISRLWQCLVWWKLGQTWRLDLNLPELLRLIHDQDYEFLLTTQTLLSPPQPRELIPLLIYARRKGVQRPFIETVLYSLGLSSIESHPGYQLKVFTLGQFKTYRGEVEVLPGDWQREKARQLFQLLVTQHNHSLERDQLVEYLWPEVEMDIGRRNFRVALSTLQRVLVPSHQRDDDPIYIHREGSLYSLRDNADIWVDAWEFKRLVEVCSNIPDSQSEMRVQQFRAALALYKGDYLQDNIYAEWSVQERENLRTLYVQTASQLAVLLSKAGDWNGVLGTCQSLLLRDSCWEEAYRLLMVAYDHLGNRPAVLRIFQKCTETLRTELDISPSAATIATYKAIFPNPPLL